MKSLFIKLILISLYFVVGCTPSSESIDFNSLRPPDVPKNVPEVWTEWHHRAYEDGRIYYNSDSTIMMIKSDRKGLNLNDFGDTEILIQ
tara:strand:- start:6404 stop:6670 length:267 start_codon:yes stop_codon:yes gene_type:complete